jgi:hypothetical protein
VRATIGVLGFLGVSALGGAAALIPGGDTAPSQEWLEDIPVVDSWLVPGLVLGVGFGLGSLVVAYGMLRRPRWHWLRPVEWLTGHHWSWLATIVIGAGQVAWIVLELIYLPELSPLEAVYGGVGLALVFMPMFRPVRDDLRVDSRSSQRLSAT